MSDDKTKPKDESDLTTGVKDESKAGSEPTKSGSRVLLMNSQSAENWDDIPLAARQQLGDVGNLRDARSGNTVNEKLGDPGSGTGAGVSEVTYHLDSTPPPAHPADGPGTKAGMAARAVSDSDSGSSRLVQDGFGYRQSYSADKRSTMRTEPGRDERIMAAKDEEHTASAIDVADGGSGGHKMMPQGHAQTADDQKGVFQGNVETGSQSSSGSAASTVARDDASRTQSTASASASGTQSSTSDKSAESTTTASPNESTGVTRGATTDDTGQPTSDSTEVPDGNVGEVLEWVGNDRDRAKTAMAVENQKDKPRSGLLRELNERL